MESPIVIHLEPAWDGDGEAPIGLLCMAALLTALIFASCAGRLLGPPRGTTDAEALCGGSRAALIVAHPDDEAYFFWPTLRQLHHANIRLSVLCLSNGNFDGLGAVRAVEMQRSCAQVGVEGSDLVVLDLEELQDGPHAWDENAVAEQVASFVREREVNVVFTFDGGGVSGHPNHVSTSFGVRRILHKLGPGPLPRILMLETIAPQWRYFGLLSAWVTQDARTTFKAPIFAGVGAVRAHRSQLLWYRWFMAVLSRYAYVNTYKDFIPERTPGNDEKKTN